MTNLAVNVRHLDGQSLQCTASRVTVSDDALVLSISPGHSLLLAPLTQSKVTIYGDDTHTLQVGSGLLRVEPNRVSMTVFH